MRKNRPTVSETLRALILQLMLLNRRRLILKKRRAEQQAKLAAQKAKAAEAKARAEQAAKAPVLLIRKQKKSLSKLLTDFTGRRH